MPPLLLPLPPLLPLLAMRTRTMLSHLRPLRDLGHSRRPSTDQIARMHVVNSKTQWLAERANTLMSEVLDARNARLNKARVLLTEVKGKVPLEELMKASRAFVCESSIDMKVQAHMELSPSRPPLVRARVRVRAAHLMPTAPAMTPASHP